MEERKGVNMGTNITSKGKQGSLRKLVVSPARPSGRQPVQTRTMRRCHGPCTAAGVLHECFPLSGTFWGLFGYPVAQFGVREFEV